MTNNNPTATLTLTQVDEVAKLIIPTWNGYPKPSPAQIRATVNRYCDNPSMTRSDRARIRVRIEQHFA